MLCRDSRADCGLAGRSPFLTELVAVPRRMAAVDIGLTAAYVRLFVGDCVGNVRRLSERVLDTFVDIGLTCPCAPLMRSGGHAQRIASRR